MEKEQSATQKKKTKQLREVELVIQLLVRKRKKERENVVGQERQADVWAGKR